MTEIPDDVRELASRLFDMARTGDETLVQYIDHGISPDLSNEDGNSLLMLAAYRGNLATVEALIDRGADVDLRNSRDQSPIAGALFKGEERIVVALRDAGADLDAGTPNARATAEMFGRSHLLE